jgi:arylsulfatase A-like enzyme
MLGDHHLWRKSLPYEPSARVPLLIRGPEHLGFRPRSVIDAPVGLQDIMPTVLEMAGVETPDTVEGRSLLPLLRGEGEAPRDHMHIEHSPLFHALTDGREKYVWFVRDGREQFFDLEQDPGECSDLMQDSSRREEIETWRGYLVQELGSRDCGWVKDGRPFCPSDEPLVSPWRDVRYTGD